LCLAQAGIAVSKMITGNSHPALQVKYYQDVAEGGALMRKFLSDIICE